MARAKPAAWSGKLKVASSRPIEMTKGRRASGLAVAGCLARAGASAFAT